MKNKGLPIFAFFEVLQTEYICAEIRVKIFQKRYAPYWRKVMEGKKVKIEDIALKNRLSSIFSSRDQYMKIYRRIVPEWGMPLFSYIDNRQREKLEKWDIVFFFNKEGEIRIQEESGSTSIGIIIDNSKCLEEFPTLLVKRRGESQSLIIPVKRVSRIL